MKYREFFRLSTGDRVRRTVDGRRGVVVENTSTPQEATGYVFLKWDDGRFGYLGGVCDYLYLEKE